MAAGGEFVEGWLVAQVLGEGAYGEVRLLRHRGSGAAVALKVVGGGAGGAREAALHGALRHAHVLRCLGARAHQQHHYLFLEWARGGELFARIAPDVGLPASAARRHWRQLLAGLRYLHARGVAHRDIKPENLLLDHNDDIKISDFGMATLFRHGTRERLLSRVCGTVPYAAPEVLRAAAAPYRAPPADVWPAALVLLAMLAGELPWERASDEDARYVEWSQWVTSQQASSPPPRGAWRKLSAPALALLRAALHPDASRRASLDALLQHEWLAEHDAPRAEAEGRWCRSQPAAAPSALSAADMEALIRHSQPAAADEPRDEGGERRAAWSVALRVRADEALRALGAELRRRGHCARRLHPRLLAATCADGLKLRVWALPVQAAGAEGTLLEFRRWRGCGLHFKRRFVELRDALRHLEAPRDTDTDADTMSQ